MSTDTRTIRITGEPQRRYAHQVVDRIVTGGERVWEIVVRPHEDKRTLDQNAKLWACCSDIAEQVEWHGRYLKKEDWKQIFVAALKGQDAVPGINGGFVVLGGSSRNLRKREFIDLLDIIQAFGADHGVEWSERAANVFDEYEVAA
ncbi:recombination protein NinB [Salinisphaera hydrothermalis]|uniref:Phage nin-region protein n=1 Tax=Salinisphaera hydrothermalis (strain C41B8) TaxID=1304275 RepID=A0A084INQ7_SALHC|nr:recombination protein NinB [Salinisphaera hydrothermalis]KEZ78341.1 phage nin-region protein [Salinisphaera hydrothermalis C41B8]